MVLLLGLMFALAPTRGHAAEYTIGPVPAWVVPVAPGVSDVGQISKGNNGVAYLLTDTQILTGDHGRVHYRRLVSTALNTSGVSSIANIEILFDPSCQTLTLHSIDIVRDGRVIHKLATANVRVLQREPELEARIYDGTRTASIFLDDVRAGDTVDYAYSISGSNPVFKGAEFGTVLLQYGSPVARIHARLLLPLGRYVSLVGRHTALKATITEHDGWRDHVWDVLDPPALTVERGAPDWYSPFAEIAWSEYPDWAAVAAWAGPLYQVPARLSPALQQEVDRIAGAQPTPAGRMLAALRLVQGEVRYLGVEIGQNSHAPNPPAWVFDRRFGDCKDKTLLLLTLLDRLGVDAHAALVNTSLRRGIADALPNPAAFDHVLVRARVDGKTWWIDPTRYTQQADLSHLYQPDFGLALIVAPDTRDLTNMTRAASAAGSRSLVARFDAGDGFDKPVRFTVETTTTGEAAESLRASLFSTNLEDVQKNYLNFYAASYPHISVATPLQVDDDKPGNRITTTETYVIDDMAQPSTDGKSSIADLFMPDVSQLLRDPAVTVRKAPLQLAHPVNVSQRTEVRLAGDWSIDPTSERIDDPAFRFGHTVKLEDDWLVITAHYQTLADEVAAADMPRYLANLARAREMAGYELSWGSPSGASSASGLDRVNWPVTLLALALFGLWTWLAMTVYRHDPAPPAARDDRWAGIGGWLLLLALALVARPFVYGFQLFTFTEAVSAENWTLLTTYGSSSYHALWAPLLMFELAANSLQFVFSLLLLVLFFKRRSNFPRVAIVLLPAGVLLQVADLALSSLLPAVETEPKDIAEVVRATFGVCIWVAYLMRSERVKATFVRRYRTVMPPALPPRFVEKAVVESPPNAAIETE